jgi:hypothetical protein
LLSKILTYEEERTRVGSVERHRKADGRARGKRAKGGGETGEVLDEEEGQSYADQSNHSGDDEGPFWSEVVPNRSESLGSVQKTEDKILNDFVWQSGGERVGSPDSSASLSNRSTQSIARASECGRVRFGADKPFQVTCRTVPASDEEGVEDDEERDDRRDFIVSESLHVFASIQPKSYLKSFSQTDQREGKKQGGEGRRTMTRPRTR